MPTKREISPEAVIKKITKRLNNMYLDDLVVVASSILDDQYTCDDDALIMVEKTT